MIEFLQRKRPNFLYKLHDTEPMSEYQYYEFLAIDRPLTADEMAAAGWRV